MINAFLYSLVELAQAAGGAHGASHEEGVPAVVYYQAVNVLIFVGILVWFTKDKVKSLYQQRLADYNRLAAETENARKELESKKSDLVRRSQQLKATSEQSLKDAKLEADKFYQSELQKTKEQAAKLAKDVEAQIVADQQKMIEKLRQEALELSVVAAEKQFHALGVDEKQKVTQRVQTRIEGASV